uniref:Uncharacterized protein n=1 Tax=viral metagenome TaxID=1070528 RepID=A0A6C0CLV8_9ZZZZ
MLTVYLTIEDNSNTNFGEYKYPLYIHKFLDINYTLFGLNWIDDDNRTILFKCMDSMSRYIGSNVTEHHIDKYMDNYTFEFT